MLLKVNNIEKIYGQGKQKVHALDGVSFEMERGEFIAIMGPSGSGKTTLLNTIATLDKVSSGAIQINGTKINQLNKKELKEFRRDELGFVFQEFNLLDTLSAYENIALALTIQGVPYKQIDSKIQEISRILGITQVLPRFPYEMSGGQKQRVAIARALVSDPALILADEPTGALDSKASRDLLMRLTMLNKEDKASILMVTHDAFTASYANRILFIKDGKIFNELYKGEQSRKDFFDQIIDVMTVLGGDVDDVL